MYQPPGPVTAKLYDLGVHDCPFLQSLNAPAHVANLNLGSCRRLQSVQFLGGDLEVLKLTSCDELQTVQILPPDLTRRGGRRPADVLEVDVSSCPALQSISVYDGNHGRRPAFGTQVSLRDCALLSSVTIRLELKRMEVKECPGIKDLEAFQVAAHSLTEITQPTQQEQADCRW